MRSLFYALARFLGDINAIRRGKFGKRLVRRYAGKLTSRAMNKVLPR